MPTMELTKDGDVHILTLTNGVGENRFTADVVGEYNAVLDKLEAFSGNTALIVASNDPKFWCNGINLEWAMAQPPEGIVKNLGKMLDKLFLRFTLLNMPTVGCLNGHTYAGGAVLAATLDFRFMRADRGFFCFPEVDIGIPFTPVMQQILDFLPDHLALTELLLTGRRIGGLEAREKQVVMAAYPQEELWKKTMDMARMLALKDRGTYTTIKRNMRRTLADILKNWQD
jgi:enoyl-CoA hydratase/carnithine racemase